MESEKIVFKQSKFRQFAYRRVKIGLIGEGQIHGEDDAISMRPYQASLRCTVPNSEVLVLARETFYTYFKTNQECWKNALKQAKIKEEEYIRRCRSYLDMNRVVLEESKTVAIQGIKKDCKVTPDDFRKYEKIEDRLRKRKFLDDMDKKNREKRNASKNSNPDKNMSIDAMSDDISPETSPARPEKSYMNQTMNTTQMNTTM